MVAQGTVPQQTVQFPIRTLRVAVVAGPDAGRSEMTSGETVTVGTGNGNDLILTDPTVSRYHLELSQTPLGIRVADCGSTNGTSAGSVRIERATVVPGTRVQLGDTTIQIDDGDRTTVPLHPGDCLAGLWGKTPQMRRLMARLERAAQSDVPALLQGESGTGKELMARALHELGPRKGQPFVTVDCGSLAPTLVASELFGHERGAFTGADRQHVGAFERANGGTLFLDEIGELPGSLQATLLGALERKRFRRLGGRSDISVSVRVVSATHRDLRAAVNDGSFRLDLYYRLAVVTLRVLPLRERADDIPVLVAHFLRECGHDGPTEELISPPTMQALAKHHWPGNVRELRNLIEATVAMGETPSLTDGSRAAVMSGDPATDPIGALLELKYKDARGSLLRDFESRYLARLLERSEGNVSAAARTASMDRSHLIDLLRRHGLR